MIYIYGTSRIAIFCRASENILVVINNHMENIKDICFRTFIAKGIKNKDR